MSASSISAIPTSSGLYRLDRPEQVITIAGNETHEIKEKSSKKDNCEYY
jgi:hypothetical protein